MSFKNINNIKFISSGNKEQDEATSSNIIIRERRLDGNICPNGCGIMIFETDFKRICPKCNFTQFSNSSLR